VACALICFLLRTTDVMNIRRVPCLTDGLCCRDKGAGKTTILDIITIAEISVI